MRNTTLQKLQTQAKRFIKNINWPTVGKWSFRIFAAGVLFISILFIYYSYSLPNPNQLLERQVAESTKIYGKDGTVLYEIHGEFNRTLIPLDQVSDNLKNATVAIEDKDFYKHKGISITGIVRSVIVDVFTGSKSQGGSTITQQFVKNALLSREKRISRKLKEIILSIEIEARFSKNDILKLYLNEIPYGRNTYGIEAASRAYFGKSAKELNIAESSYLAAIPQAPTYYNPLGLHRDALDARKNVVLTQMKDQGYITEDQFNEAKNSVVTFRAVKSAIIAPHFVLYVQDYLASKYGEKTLQEGGLKVYTTLDPRLQSIAETAVTEELAKNGAKRNAHNAALVAMDPKTGQILAMVGSKDYFGESEPAGCTPGKNCTFEPNVNVATSERQPGSSFKPYVYVTAFKKEFGYSPATMLMDVITNFGNNGGGGDYIPKNFNGNQYGPVSMRQGLAGSLNIPAVKTLALIGVDNATQTAHSLGITSPLSNCGLSLVLGGCEVKLLDHTASYGVLANGGVKHEKTAILKIEDSKGTVLEEYKEKSDEILDPQAVYQLTSIMTDNNARSFIFGSGSPLTLPGRPVAAKTGTTNNFRDGWTLGFTPSLVAGVWTGNNNGDYLKADAVVVAAPIWNRFMRDALKDTPVEEFKEPEGIKHITIDKISGKLPTDITPETKNEVFADYNVPTERDNVHVAVLIDSTTGQPANDSTPPENIATKIYTVLHSEKPDNANWETPVVNWALANGYEYPPSGSNTTTNPPPGQNGQGPTVSITSPKDNTTITSSSFSVQATASGPNPITKVDLLIDGEFYQSLNSSPYNFSVNKKYPDGGHTLTIRAVDNKNLTSETSNSINIKTAVLNNQIDLIQPQSNQTMSFPATLIASSPGAFDAVTFYYQSGNTIKTIGTSTDTIDLGDHYEYKIKWNISPKTGFYKLFVKTDTGLSSPKITVIVP